MKNFYKNKKILITGGLGFIGSTLAHRLVEQDADVTIVDAMVPDTGACMFNIEEIRDKVEVEIFDLVDADASNEAVDDRDLIFNLAGLLAHSDSMKNPLQDLHGNCEAQLQFLESCRRVNPAAKIIYTGSRNEYGLVEQNPVDEEHGLDPSDINSINLTANAGYHRLYSRVYDMDICVLRLCNVYGPRHQMKHPRQGVLNWFIRQIMDGEEISLYGDGTQIRDSNYVGDVVEALLVAGASNESTGEIFNLGGSPVSLKKYVETLIKVYGSGSYKCVPFPEDAKKVEIGDYIADYSKIKNKLGWEPKVGLKEGLRKTIDYYQKNKEHYW